MNRRSLITLFHYSTGLMDALTGIFLVLAPQWTLRMMLIKEPVRSPEFIAYIGMFVFAVGCSHFLAGRYPTTAVQAERWKTLWKVSSLVRFSIAIFVLAQVLLGNLESAWITVSFTDFTVALTLSILLWKKLLDRP